MQYVLQKSIFPTWKGCDYIMIHMRNKHIKEQGSPLWEYFYNIPHDQLVSLAISSCKIEEDMRTRLHLLSGCSEFGKLDGMNGACVDCSINDKNLFERCGLFQEAVRTYLKLDSKKED